MENNGECHHKTSQLDLCAYAQVIQELILSIHILTYMYNVHAQRRREDS